jgi:GH15 family glucan-1,4-alpha-glucosidase
VGGRIDGYLPIGDYALIGDGLGAALVARDGCIDWLAVPALDSPPVCAAILDPEAGGAFACAPDQPYDVQRRYRGETNLLETTFTTATGVVRVVDVMTVGRNGTLPWRELVRRIDGLSGEVEMHWRFAPGNRLGDGQPWLRMQDDTPVVSVGDCMLALRTFDAGPPRCGAHDVTGRVTLADGDTALLALVSPGTGPVPLPRRSEIEDRLRLTEDYWHRWVDGIRYDGPWRDAVVRSALVLQLLQFAETGAIAAAPTTSLPERIGGTWNWDYRFAWIRDASFTLDAFLRLHLPEAAQFAMDFLLRVTADGAPEVPVFAGLRGETPGPEEELPDVAGYRRSQPVRRGNAAASQRQLGNYGDLFESVWLYVDDGHSLDHETGGMLAAVADHVCDSWRLDDSGIWELMDQQHYTISKMGCWVALDRATRLAERGHLPDRRAPRWRAERDAVHDWVEQHCWSEQRSAYTFYAGSDELDAAVLLAARTGFDKPDHPRLVSTLDAVREELSEDGLLYRYSSMRGQEGAFVACSFWLADALARADRLDEAAEVIEAVLARTNDVGLLAEEIEPASGAMLGNFPQGLSHLALVTSCSTFAEIAGR